MKRNVQMWIGLSLVPALLVLFWLARLFLHYIPVYPLSYMVWCGILVTSMGSLGIILPFKKVRFKNRNRSAAIMLSGVILSLISICWPQSLKTSDREHQRLDDFLPQFQGMEYHQSIVKIPIDKLMDAAPTISMADIPMADFLFRARAIFIGQHYEPDPRPFLDIKPGSGFLVLDDSNPGERVYGMVGRPWVDEPPPELHSPEQFRAFNQPGHIKVAFNIRIMEQGDRGVLISSETRVIGNDESAQKRFARYWRLIYPGSAIIRRLWLDAIIDKANPSSPSGR